MAFDQAGLGGWSGGRRSYGACVEIAVAAAVVAARQSLMAVADLVGECAKSMGWVGNEGDRRKVRHRPLKVRERERADGSCGAEA